MTGIAHIREQRVRNFMTVLDFSRCTHRVVVTTQVEVAGKVQGVFRDT